MPSASQYIQIKRLQAGINGKLANTKPNTKRGAYSYDGYAGSGISALPPNALESNKFIVTTILPLPEEPKNGGIQL